LSQSGSFLTAAGQESPAVVWDGEAPGMLVRQFVQSPTLPLMFYIEVGRYETTFPFSPLLETRRLRDVLQAKDMASPIPSSSVATTRFVGEARSPTPSWRSPPNGDQKNKEVMRTCSISDVSAHRPALDRVASRRYGGQIGSGTYALGAFCTAVTLVP
jgi:hypothetical protein